MRAANPGPSQLGPQVREGTGLTTQLNKGAAWHSAADNGSPHPCKTYGLARLAQRLDSTARGRRSLIMMKPLVQVQPGPPHQ